MRRDLFQTIVCLVFAARASPAEPAGGPPTLGLSPPPQIVQPSAGDFVVRETTRILIPEGWPAWVRISAEELSDAIAAPAGAAAAPRPAVVERERGGTVRGSIAVGPWDWFRDLPWHEPAAAAINRPASPEGYSLRVTPDHVTLAGNSPRACFHGLQTLIQLAHRMRAVQPSGRALPGVLIGDWPAHPWRTLQLPLGVYGNAYERGEHLYRHITKVDLLERAIRLAAHRKMTGLVVEAGSGVSYERLPEVFVEGFAGNEKARLRAAVDLAKSLGLDIVPFLNASAAHDIWLGPYPYAVPNGDLYLEALFEAIEELIGVCRSPFFHIGMDEDVARDFDERALRDVATHERVLLACHAFLRRQGITTLIWNDGLMLLPEDRRHIPRDVIVLPWYYGGADFSPAREYVDRGFRILCSPWSQWHVENDHFYSLYAASLKSDRVLGMAGTIWYPVAPDAEADYRRCLVKAADAFWSPLRVTAYPSEAECSAPQYTGLPRPDGLPRPVPFGASVPLGVPGGFATSAGLAPASTPASAARLAAFLADGGGDPVECEAARERLVAAGTAVVPALLEAIAGHGEPSPWIEGTLRRIVREPAGDPAPMTAALREAARSGGPARALSLELLARVGDGEFLLQQDDADPVVCAAMGAGNDPRFAAALVRRAAAGSAASVQAIRALGRLRARPELLSLMPAAGRMDEASRETYARAVACLAVEDAVPVLAELATDPAWLVRFRAAIGLGATRSSRAGPAILKLLDDPHPAVAKVALWWCTDTFILRPEEWFPPLVARLKATTAGTTGTPGTTGTAAALGRDDEVLRAILHALLLMHDPQRGQWLARAEDPSRRIDYARLAVWKDPVLQAALRGLLSHSDRRLAIDALLVLVKCGAELPADEVVGIVRGFPIEDQRWFCTRVRDDGSPQAAPILRRLWSSPDSLVRTFIIQYCQRVPTAEAFDLAYEANAGLAYEAQAGLAREANAGSHPEDPLRRGALWALAAHVNGLDEKARRAIPLLLEAYERSDPEARRFFDAALCRAAGRGEPPADLGDAAEDVARRLGDWRAWWALQGPRDGR